MPSNNPSATQSDLFPAPITDKQVSEEQKPFLLSEKTHEQIYSDLVEVSLVGSQASEKPIAVILGGQPGSGKTGLSTIASQSIPKTESYVLINADTFRESHPHYEPLQRQHNYKASYLVDPDVSVWTRRLIADAIREKRNIIIDNTLGGQLNAIEKTLENLKHNGYRTQLHVLSVNERLSKLGIYSRYERQFEQKGYGRFVRMASHDQNYKQISENVEALERNKNLDQITIYGRKTERKEDPTGVSFPHYYLTLYHNQRLSTTKTLDTQTESEHRLTQGWEHHPQAQLALEKERNRVLTVREKQLLDWKASQIFKSRENRGEDSEQMISDLGFSFLTNKDNRPTLLTRKGLNAEYLEYRNIKAELIEAKFPPILTNKTITPYYEKVKEKWVNGVEKNAILIVVPSSSGKNLMPNFLAERLIQDRSDLTKLDASIQVLHKGESKALLHYIDKVKDMRQFKLSVQAVEKLTEAQQQSRPIYIIDDLLTSGGSVVSLKSEIEKHGLKVNGILNIMSKSTYPTSKELGVWFSQIEKFVPDTIHASKQKLNEFKKDFQYIFEQHPRHKFTILSWEIKNKVVTDPYSLIIEEAKALQKLKWVDLKTGVEVKTDTRLEQSDGKEIALQNGLAKDTSLGKGLGNQAETKNIQGQQELEKKDTKLKKGPSL
ncbi:zeta toxin family protein [Cytophagaceae bacterium DM2B3-1]|uniref:Zeta toxin family protein n=1 Tax=Xanthocytophaga flava TaxID=3048013 RepID=A0ABT7CUX9_9BACT|nr:zeta toxin family protein [Xanthocytophaga flavus]MDJ1497578.1 zeta toxin family protein [Xanthocytophaga flavus]